MRSLHRERLRFAEYFQDSPAEEAVVVRLAFRSNVVIAWEQLMTRLISRSRALNWRLFGPGLLLLSRVCR